MYSSSIPISFYNQGQQTLLGGDLISRIQFDEVSFVMRITFVFSASSAVLGSTGVDEEETLDFASSS